MSAAYRERTIELANTSERTVNLLWAAYTGAQLARGDFIDAGIAALLSILNQATGLADVASAAALSQLLGQVLAPSGVILPNQEDRLQQALTTLADRGDTPAAVRFGRTEPLTAGRWAYSQTLRRHHQRVGWRRITGPDPCPLCTKLAIADFVPADVTPIDHPACSCVQQPVLSG